MFKKLLLYNVISTILFIIYNAALFECRNRTDLEKLIDQIFTIDSYNNLVRPVDKQSGLTVVSTELKVLQIDLDEKYQELVSTVWIEMTWEDPRLKWDSSTYDNITEITLPISKLWVPDIVLQNGVGRNEYLNEMKYFNPWISHTGVITWVPEIRLHTRCLIKVSDFPFDTQCCEINFYSWAHTVKQMKIEQFGNKNITNVTHLSYNTEWQVFHTCALSKIIVTNEELHWWVTSYVIFIKRHTSYHIYTLLMPCFVLSMLSMLLFLLPPDSGEKVTLGVTILLAFFVNSLVVSNYTPEATSDLPVIGIYYVFNIGLVSVSVGTSVCVLNFHFRGHKVTEVPLWLKHLLLVKSNGSNQNTKISSSFKYPFRKFKMKNDNSINHNINNLSFLNRKNHYYLNDVKYLNENVKMNENHNQNINYFYALNNNSLNDQQVIQMIDDTSQSNESDCQHRRNLMGDNLIKRKKSFKNNYDCQKEENFKDNLDKILKVLKKNSRLLEKSRQDKVNTQMIYDDWKEIASRIDLLLFLIASTIVILAPVFLFGKFFIRDETFSNFNHTCGCS